MTEDELLRYFERVEAMAVSEETKRRLRTYVGAVKLVEDCNARGVEPNLDGVSRMAAVETWGEVVPRLLSVIESARQQKQTLDRAWLEERLHRQRRSGSAD